MSFKESQMGTSSTEYQESISEYAMQLTSASVLPSVLKAAIDLGVLEIIRKAGPGALLSASQIASELSTHSNDNLVSSLLLDCMLRVLASHSILTCSITHQNDGHVLRLYGLAPVSKYFDRNQDGGTLAPVLDFMQDKVIMSIWDHLKDAVLEGVLPFYKAHGVNMSHEFMGKEGRLRETFHVAHGSFNQVFMEKILETYNGFEGLKSLVDVGGGDGTILNIIISKYPSIKGVNFDLATVIEKLPPYPGIEHVAGDMFVNIPKGDAIFMKWMIHQHVDKDSLKVLKNCYEALPKRGKVIMVDMVVPEVTETSAAHKSLFQLYLFLLNSNSQGKERTKREFESLGKAAGFSSIQVEGFAYGYSLVEFYKNM